MSQLTVMTYHSLDDSGSPISVDASTFRRHVGWLAKHGFRSFTLSDAMARLRSGQLPPRAIAITFDDGFLTTATIGLPTLAAHGFTATVFLVSDYVGRQNDFPTQPRGVPRLPLMDWPTVRSLQAADWEIGAHTCTHADLTRLSPEEVCAELRNCREVIEERLGSRVSALAYPYGRQAARERTIAAKTYATAVTTRLGLTDNSSDPFATQRLDAYYLTRPDLLRFMGGPLLAPYLHLRQTIRDLRGVT